MISSLQVFNFQSHRKSKLEFHSGMNAITGASDSGKTALLRALLWVLTNRPAGDAYRSTWGGDTMASLIVDTGRNGAERITRLKSGKENIYEQEWNVPGGEGDKGRQFRAIGQEVPKEVSDSLNLNSVNVQSQMDAPFMLSMSPGEVARYLNQITHLDIIDKTLSSLGKMARDIERSIVNEKNRIINLENKIIGWAYLDELENRIACLEEAKAILIRTDEIHDKLAKFPADIMRQKVQISNADNILKHEKQILKLDELNAEHTQYIEQLFGLRVLVTDAVAYSKKSAEAEMILKHESMIQGLAEKQKKRKQLNESNVLLYNMVKNMKEGEATLSLCMTKVEKLEQEFKRLAPEICPLCGQRVEKW